MPKKRYTPEEIVAKLRQAPIIGDLAHTDLADRVSNILAL
jgi:hypothetical protein